MILLIDVGNSRIKWQLWSGDLGVVRSCSHLVELQAQLGEHLKGRVGLAAIYVSSVRDKLFANQLRELCQSEFNLTPVFAGVVENCCGLTPAYDNLEKLGVDRWLALLAAYAESKSAVVVIDAGTAITVDYVNGQGQHLGGLIVPGVQTVARALLSDTSAIDVGALTLPQTWQPGCDTLSCVEQGVAASIKGLMSEVVAYAQRVSSTGEAATIYITGGDAQYIKLWLPSVAQDDPCLVQKGLLLSQGVSEQQ